MVVVGAVHAGPSVPEPDLRFPFRFLRHPHGGRGVTTVRARTAGGAGRERRRGANREQTRPGRRRRDRPARHGLQRRRRQRRHDDGDHHGDQRRGRDDGVVPTTEAVATTPAPTTPPPTTQPPPTTIDVEALKAQIAADYVRRRGSARAAGQQSDARPTSTPDSAQIVAARVRRARPRSARLRRGHGRPPVSESSTACPTTRR